MNFIEKKNFKGILKKCNNLNKKKLIFYLYTTKRKIR